MNEMLKWRLIVEIASKPASAQFLKRICSDTPENRKHLEDLKRHAKQIEDEETRAFDVPLDVQAIPDEQDKDAQTFGRHLRLPLSNLWKREVCPTTQKGNRLSNMFLNQSC